MDAIFNYKRKQEEDYYFLLGCDELSSTDQIQTEYKIRALDLHPDKNQGDETAVQKFQLLQKAKDVLLDPEKRQEYDKWRRGGLAMSFDQWSNLSKCAHTSMHWASKKQKEPMLEPPVEPQDPQNSSQVDDGMIKTSASQSEADPVNSDNTKLMGGWQRDTGNDLLKKFRNYEI